MNIKTNAEKERLRKLTTGYPVEFVYSFEGA